MTDEILALTMNELKVFQTLNKGMTGPEAARELFLAPDTVKSHTARVRRKLGVNTTAKAVGVLRDAGILSTDGPCVCRSASQGKSLVEERPRPQATPPES